MSTKLSLVLILAAVAMPATLLRAADKSPHKASPSGTRVSQQSQGSAPAHQVDCAGLGAQLDAAPADQRTRLVHDGLEGKCKPMPSSVWEALQTGKWKDGQALSDDDRVLLISVADTGQYAEAETLAVGAIGSGTWSDGSALSLTDGGKLIRSLKPVLTTYRVHLLMDVYEQVTDPWIRGAVIETLAGSNLPEALLPAIDSYWSGTDKIQAAAVAALEAQPEKVPEKVLARVILQVPDGAIFTWAKTLAEHHPSPEVQAALKKRGA